jgi:hypothetical protein
MSTHGLELGFRLAQKLLRALAVSGFAAGQVGPGPIDEGAGPALAQVCPAQRIYCSLKSGQSLRPVPFGHGQVGDMACIRGRLGARVTTCHNVDGRGGLL